MKIITLDAMQEAVRAIVATAPEGYVYPYARIPSKQSTGTCNYVVGGAPSCLIGQALARLGVPIATLQVMDAGNSGIYEPRVLDILGKASFYLEREAVLYAAGAQSAQDNGDTWVGAEALGATLPTIKLETQSDRLHAWYDKNPLPLTDENGNSNA